MIIGKVYSYYGQLDGEKPIRSLGEDLQNERNKGIMQELREMEERVKRHVTECKRSVIKEIYKITAELFTLKKELKNGCKCKQ